MSTEFDEEYRKAKDGLTEGEVDLLLPAAIHAFEEAVKRSVIRGDYGRVLSKAEVDSRQRVFERQVTRMNVLAKLWLEYQLERLAS